ncbi:DUF2950 family protein [Elioraea rosea]|uniref:DUF2950 family protein n=1 Tax=Elioraea rosea TaxID=2492390 RepID=UPI001315127F|nr:DUF2950 family protein [Elioraea rosea]
MHRSLRQVALCLAVLLTAPAADPGRARAQADTGGVVRMEPIPDRPQQSQPPAQRAFATPEAAIEAMIAALREPGFEALTRILGPRVAAAIPPAERRSAEVRRTAADQLSRTPFSISYLDEARTRATALFGPDRNPLPATLARSGRGWVFDQAATIEAMRERRIGVNEANALLALRALASAQAAFRRRDMVGDGVLQYAQRIASRPGTTDGLAPSQDGALPGAALGLNEAFARAEGRPGDPTFRPPGGYGYRILTAQGPAAEGGAKSYLRDGRLTEGYAVIAWPVRPGETGLSTFIMDWRGNIYEREFGAETLGAVTRITTFDPEPGWEPVDPSDK